MGVRIRRKIRSRFSSSDFGRHRKWYFTSKNYSRNRLQFTGLHDKNGREIYEGDIIVSQDYSHARHYVRYIDDEAMFVAMIIGSSLMEYCAIRQSWIDKYDKKIIGNIYDDPELVGKIN